MVNTQTVLQTQMWEHMEKHKVRRDFDISLSKWRNDDVNDEGQDMT